MIGRLKPKWNPTQMGQGDGLSLTKNRKRANESARGCNERIIFDPSITEDMPLASVFRVFTSSAHEKDETAHRPPRPFGMRGEDTEVFTDGCCIMNGTADAVAGSGVWFGAGDERNEGARVPYEGQSNQTGEIYAVILAGQKVPPFVPLHVVSDSKYVVDGLTTNLRSWEDKGWIGVANAELFRDAAAGMRARSAVTTFRWVKGHSKVLGNEEADKLARVGTEKRMPFRPRGLPLFKYMRNGAALASMTQSLAYQGVKLAMGTAVRKATKRNLMLTAVAIKEACGRTPTEGRVWEGLRKDPVSRKVRDFLWKAIHGAHRIGQYWEHIPGYEERGACASCGGREDMSHILTECSAPGQSLIWKVVRDLFRRKMINMPMPSLGLMLGAHIYEVGSGDGTT
ncbi:Ribonuclease H1, partial [Trametes pubescens]